MEKQSLWFCQNWMNPEQKNEKSSDQRKWMNSLNKKSSDRSNWRQTFLNFPASPPFFIYLAEQIWKQMTFNFKGFECSLSFTFWGRFAKFHISWYKNIPGVQILLVLQMLLALWSSFLTLCSHLCCCCWQRFFENKAKQFWFIMSQIWSMVGNVSIIFVQTSDACFIFS